MNLCLHCLEEGDWYDDDCCPTCRVGGHESPWRVSSCRACNSQFFAKMAELSDRIDARVRTELADCHLLWGVCEDRP